MVSFTVKVVPTRWCRWLQFCESENNRLLGSISFFFLDQCLIRNESTRSSPVWPGFDFRTQRCIYVEFVVSLLGPGVFHLELWKSFLFKNRPLIRFELVSPQTRGTIVHLAIDYNHI